jgi:hypothetical protein
MPDEVFRAFWALCVGVADMAYAYNLSNEDGLHCAWRRHSLVISFRHRNSVCEMSVHRRKTFAICASSLRKLNIWQAEAVRIDEETLAFLIDGAVVGISEAADRLFKSIVSYATQVRGVAPLMSMQNT